MSDDIQVNVGLMLSHDETVFLGLLMSPVVDNKMSIKELVENAKVVNSVMDRIGKDGLEDLFLRIGAYHDSICGGTHDPN